MTVHRKSEQPTSDTASFPLVTVAFPLYKSARFVENIIGNIERCDYPNLAIIISDRHSADNALTQLQAHFAQRDDIRYLQATDELAWERHYDLLLNMADSPYFLWMPHDDWYPSDYIGQLVLALEQEPAAVVAFGRVEIIRIPDEHNETIVLAEGFLPDAPFSADESPSPKLSLRLYLFWMPALPFRGLFRLEQVCNSVPHLPITYKGYDADNGWLFGLSLHHKFLFVPDCFCRKRAYDTSTTVERIKRATWHHVFPRRLTELRILLTYLWQSGHALPKKLSATLILLLYVTHATLRIVLNVLCDLWSPLCRWRSLLNRPKQQAIQLIRRHLGAR